MKGRKKGTTKTGGRQKGTPNKATATLREWVQAIIDDHREQIVEDLKVLSPRDRVQTLLKLLDYCVPKLQSINTKIDIDQLSDEQLDSVIHQLAEGIEYENSFN